MFCQGYWRGLGRRGLGLKGCNFFNLIQANLRQAIDLKLPMRPLCILLLLLIYSTWQDFKNDIIYLKHCPLCHFHFLSSDAFVFWVFDGEAEVDFFKFVGL